MYLGEYYKGTPDGTSVKSIIKQARSNINGEMSKHINNRHSPEEAYEKFGDDLRKVTVVENAIKNGSGLGKLIIANQSSKLIQQKLTIR